MKEIILRESDAEIIRSCEQAIYQAFKELGLKEIVIIDSEPPLISRNQLWGQLPVLEINQLRRRLHPGPTIYRGGSQTAFQYFWVYRCVGLSRPKK